MAIKKRWIAALIFGLVATAAYASRGPLGRDHPCWMTLYSFDDGPFTFEYTYIGGRVGPFAIGQTKDEAASALSRWPKQFILSMEMSHTDYERFYLTRNSVVSPDMRRFLGRSDQWTVLIRTEGCGYALYRPSFVGGKLKQVFLHKSAFDGS